MIRIKYINIFIFMLFLSVSHIGYGQEKYEAGKIKIKMKQETASKISGKLEKSTMLKASSNGKLDIGNSELEVALKKVKTNTLKRLIPYNPKYDARHRAMGLDQWFVLDIEENVEQAVELLSGQQDVIFAEPVYKITRQGIAADDKYPVNDPLIQQQWNYSFDGRNPNLGGARVGVAGTDIKLFDAWKVTMGTPNVVVAIIDGGVDLSHPDLKANLWVNEAELNGTSGIDDDGNGYVDDIHGANFVDERVTTIQADKHGTHVAGIVAAKADNGIGIAGVAGGKNNDDGVRIMSCQVFDLEGTSGNTAAAFVYAADKGAVIAQCSWTYQVANLYDQATLDAIDYFVEYAGKDVEGNPLPETPMSGGLVVFAAGNLDGDHFFYPSCYEKCLAVASINIDNEKASYSNYSKWVDISAPGGADDSSGGADFGQICSTVPNGYDFLSGTSMACPQVSGVAALILSAYGNEKMTPEMLKHRLQSTASAKYGHDPRYEGKLGVGMVDANAAINSELPDVDANVYFGEFPLEKINGTVVSYEKKVRILNLSAGEMILEDANISSNDFVLINFQKGMKIAAGEMAELTLKFTPSAIKEYQEFLTINYGGDFNGKSTQTQLFANVMAGEWAKIPIFQDDFEKGIYQWTSLDLSGDGRKWQFDSNSPGYLLAHSGSSYAVSQSASAGGTPYYPDNWLISPELDLIDCPENAEVLLGYWMRNFSGAYDGEHYRVLVSVNPDEEFSAEDFSEELISEYLYSSIYSDGYSYRELSLTKFIGEKIKVAFVHDSSEPHYILILDDVEVAIHPENDFVDIQLVDENFLGWELVAKEEYSLTVQIINWGNLDAQNVEISYGWIDSETVYTETIPSISAGDTIIYTLKKDKLIPESVGLHTLKVIVNCDGDFLPTNNEYEHEIWINPYHALYKWDFEEGMPSNFYRFTFDNEEVADNLGETAWGVDWQPKSILGNRERFLVANFVYHSPHPAIGNASAVSASYFDPAGKADRWLLISVPEVKTEELLFKWGAFSADSAALEDYNVMISTKVYSGSDFTIDPDDFTVLESIKGESPVLTNHVLNITEYAGKPFYIAFRHLTDQGVVLLIDNIKLLTPEAVDLIPEKQDVREVKLYPNPIRGFFTIESPEDIKKVEIYDLSGRVVYSNIVNEKSFTLEVSQYPAGSYIIKIETVEGIITKKASFLN